MSLRMAPAGKCDGRTYRGGVWEASIGAGSLRLQVVIHESMESVAPPEAFVDKPVAP